MEQKKGNDRGYLMVSSYIMLTMASILSLGLLSRNVFFVQAMERNVNRLVAFNMAEAAMDQALVELSEDINYTGDAYTSFNTVFARGGYEVTVSTPSGRSDIRRIEAVGYAPDNTSSSRAAEQRTVVVYAQIHTQNHFDFGVFAKSGITLSGSGNVVVDSYDSRVATYNPLSPGTNGDIATNSTAGGAITLTGNAQVYGDAAIGPEGNTATAVSLGSNTLISGSTSAASEARELPEVSTSIASSGALQLSGSNTLTLSSGSYRFDSIDISARAQLNVQGAVSIYVDGNVNIAGQGIVNSTQIPPNLLLFIQGSDVQVSGGSDLYGAIYAPNAAVRVSGNGSVYGAVVGDTYSQVGGGSLHFDEALRDDGGNGVLGVEVIAWQEEGSVNWGMGE